MSLKKITHTKAPEEFLAVIEIPMNSDPVKYELDEETGLLIADRFLPASMQYPCNYGFMPNTLSGDGDPLDVLVISSFPLVHGSMIKVRPIGTLLTKDEGGQDEKVLALPVPKVDPNYKDILTYKSLPESMLKRIVYFFEHYKDLEDGKWVKVDGWEDVAKTKQIILDSIARFKG